MRRKVAHHRIAQLAGRQRGLIRRDQLLALGLSAHAIEHWIRRGWLIPVRRGVYAVGHAYLGREARWLAAAWCCGPEAVLSHLSAAVLWDLRLSSSPIIDITVPSRAGRKRRDGMRIHRVELTEHERTERAGIPVTTWPRTVLDLAATRPRRDVELALERAEQLRLFDRQALDRTLGLNSRRPGCAVLRRVVGEARIGETATRSELEEAMFALCRRHGLPRPKSNAQIGPYEADFLWSEHKLIAETDGWETHGTRAAFEHDRRRDSDLMLWGYRVVRFTRRMVLREQNAVAAALSGHLASLT